MSKNVYNHFHHGLNLENMFDEAGIAAGIGKNSHPDGWYYDVWVDPKDFDTAVEIAKTYSTDMNQLLIDVGCENKMVELGTNAELD